MQPELRKKQININNDNRKLKKVVLALFFVNISMVMLLSPKDTFAHPKNSKVGKNES